MTRCRGAFTEPRYDRRDHGAGIAGSEDVWVAIAGTSKRARPAIHGEVASLLARLMDMRVPLAAGRQDRSRSVSGGV